MGHSVDADFRSKRSEEVAPYIVDGSEITEHAGLTCIKRGPRLQLTAISFE